MYCTGEFVSLKYLIEAPIYRLVFIHYPYLNSHTPQMGRV
jgi:hypothetical protein